MRVSKELYMIFKLLMLHSYELISKYCKGPPIFNYNCSKIWEVAPEFSETGPKFSFFGQKLGIDAS